VNLSDIKKSGFLKKEEVGVGALMTISAVKKENVAKEGAPEEMKVVLYFAESEKGMVLNSTNAQMIAKLTGIENNIDTGWVGFQIVLYDDPNVSFSGKITGGIRVRAPKQGMKKIDIMTAPKSSTPEDSDLPF